MRRNILSTGAIGPLISLQSNILTTISPFYNGVSRVSAALVSLFVVVAAPLHLICKFR